MPIKKPKEVKTDFVQPTKSTEDTKITRDYNVSEAALDQRKLAAQSSAIARRSKIQDRMADRLDLILNSTTDADVADASFKDKMVATGILYDKLYRDNHAMPSNAIQINIKTIGVPEEKLEPLMIDITPKEKSDV
jgi:hypothetical protein